MERPKTKYLHIRFSDELLAQLETASQLEAVTKSAIVRDATQRAVRAILKARGMKG